MKASEIIAAFGAVPDESAEARFTALCPVHEATGESHSPSLVLTFTDERKALVRCGSVGCKTEDVLVAAGLSMRDLFDVSYVGQSLRTAKAGGAPAPVEARVTAAGTAYRRAVALAGEVAASPAGEVATFLETRFGLTSETVTAAHADHYGLGWDVERQRVTITARDVDGRVAFAQARAIDPHTPEHLRWLSDPNPEGGRWDGAGIVGPFETDRETVVVEGMTDAATLALVDRWNVVAVRGASQAKRLEEVSAVLEGATVYAVGDLDEAGSTFRDAVAQAAVVLAREVRLVDLSGLVGAKGDVSDLRDVDPATFVERWQVVLEAAEPVRREVDYNVRPYLAATDVDRARALVAYIRAEGHEIAHTAAFRFGYFDGHVWHTDAERLVKAAAHRLGDYARDRAHEETARAHAAVVGTDDKPDLGLANALRNFARLMHMAGPAKGLLDALAALPGVAMDADRFDANHDSIAAANGLVDLRTGEVREVRADDYVTRRLAVAYDPDAQAPRFEQFLREVLVTRDERVPDEELVAWMRAFVGYSTTGHTSEEIFTIWNGGGSNGKSKLVDALEHVFEPYSTVSGWSTFTDAGSGSIPNDKAALAGSRLVWVHEANRGTFDDSAVKQMTGGDKMRARFLHKEWFVFTPTFSIVMLANELAHVRDRSDGFWRRVRLVPFWAKFEKGNGADPRLAEKLRGEAAGILAWSVRGAMEWYAAGRALPACGQIDGAGATYREQTDPVGDFVSTYFVRDETAVALLTDIARAYQEWCEVEGLSPHLRKGRTSLGKALDGSALGYRDARGGGTSKRPAMWTGWRLLPTSEVEALERRAATARKRDLAGLRVVGAAAEAIA